MITITRKGNGLKVLFSAPGTGVRGFSIQVGDLNNSEELFTVIRHHFMKKHDTSVCQLCRMAREQDARWLRM